MTTHEKPWKIRRHFSKQLSVMYRKALPLYVILADQAAATNKKIIEKNKIENSVRDVSQERHGAIRLGLPEEIQLMARFYRILNMYPVNYYDFTGLASPLPITASGFRPITKKDMDKNPFRMFTSLLRLDDRRFFPEEISQKAIRQLKKRNLFSVQTIDLINKAEKDGGLNNSDAKTLIDYVIPTFKMSKTPVPKALYDEIGNYADIARDIVPFGGPHLNHLTPRTLDIQQTDKQMQDLGISMLGEIQGPKHPIPVQLWQTSFLAPPIDIIFQLEDGTYVEGTHTAQFGELEQRGAALTPKGREALINNTLALSYEDMAKQGHIYYTIQATERMKSNKLKSDIDYTLTQLLELKLITISYITYEDFLSKSARAIFSSTVKGAQGKKTVENNNILVNREKEFSTIIGTTILDSDTLYAKEQEASIKELEKKYSIRIS